MIYISIQLILLILLAQFCENSISQALSIYGEVVSTSNLSEIEVTKRRNEPLYSIPITPCLLPQKPTSVWYANLLLIIALSAVGTCVWVPITALAPKLKAYFAKQKSNEQGLND